MTVCKVIEEDANVKLQVKIKLDCPMGSKTSK